MTDDYVMRNQLPFFEAPDVESLSAQAFVAKERGRQLPKQETHKNMVSWTGSAAAVKGTRRKF